MVTTNIVGVIDTSSELCLNDGVQVSEGIFRSTPRIVLLSEERIVNSKAVTRYRTVILGAGFGGLGMAAELKRSGDTDFVVLEKAREIGGVWRENNYPGAACDTESHLYCYSFFPHLTVSRMYADRNELLGYLSRLSEHYELRSHIRLGADVELARWNSEAGEWEFTTKSGDHYASQYFIPAWGQLNTPSIPEFRGLDSFEGQIFHSAQWNQEIDITGKKVASIGSAASAVQYVPEIAQVVKRLTIFQRSPNWILPRNQIIFTKEQLAAFADDPTLFTNSRERLHSFREAGFQRTRHSTELQLEGVKLARTHMETQIPNWELRKKLTPEYEFGCKRILRSDDYYPALMRSNVTLETSPIERFVRNGIVLKNGETYVFDVVIFGTGFQSQAFHGDLCVQGLGGLSLNTYWADGAAAYLGMTVPNFPNMFMIYGPNTNLNHNSIISMLEIQQRYILSAIGDLEHRGIRAASVKQGAFDAFNDRLQVDMRGSAYSSDCSSWYKNSQGKVINNWAGTVNEYETAASWNIDHFEHLDNEVI
jgi:cation diffusion facilitator CzcD-associated flavoprotein CzcO